MPLSAAMEKQFPLFGLDIFTALDSNEITILNHHSQGKNQISQPHQHDFYLLFLIKKSKGVHEIDFLKHDVKDNQLHLLLPGQVHRWDLAPDTEGYQMMLGKKLFQKLQAHINFFPSVKFNHPVLQLNAGEFELLEQEFVHIEQELKKTKLDWHIVWLRANLVTAITSNFLANSAIDKTRTSNPHILNYLTLTEEYYKKEKSVTFYADGLNITANYLNILCQRHLHITANQVLKNRIVMEAKRLLHSSDLQINEISYLLGFNDLAYFSNFFKSHTGSSPRSFREKL